MLGLVARLNPGEHATIYILATVANLLLSIPEYLAVRTAVISNIPVDGSAAGLISSYGLGSGLTLDFLWTLLIFQGLLAIVLLTLLGSALLDRGWRLVYIFAGMFISGFVGYWIASKFLRTLNWISLLQNAGVDSSGVYSDLFWFGLVATVCYIAMILILRRSYDKLVATRSIAPRMEVRS